MDAPKKIWANCQAPLATMKSGQWHEHPYGVEYILAAEHARIVAEKDAEIADLEALQDASDTAYARGFHDAQEKAKVEGRLVLVDSPELVELRDMVARLTAERDEAIRAMKEK